MKKRLVGVLYLLSLTAFADPCSRVIGMELIDHDQSIKIKTQSQLWLNENKGFEHIVQNQPFELDVISDAIRTKDVVCFIPGFEEHGWAKVRSVIPSEEYERLVDWKKNN